MANSQEELGYFILCSFFSVSALSDSLSDVTSLRSWVDFAGVESSVLYHLFGFLVS